MRFLRRCVQTLTVLIVAASALTPAASAQTQTIVVQWDQAALNAIVSTSMPPTQAARSLSIVFQSMYDAWAAYDPVAAGSMTGAPAKQPASAMTAANKAQAVSYAAYLAAVDQWPAAATSFGTLMRQLGYDPTVTAMNQTTPVGVGTAAASEVLAFRHEDGSNQLGDLGGGAPYADYTNYTPINFPGQPLVDPNHWQPIRAANGTVQKFLSPYWGLITPFALSTGSQFRPGPPPQSGTWLYDQRMADVITLNTTLDDRAKVSAEFWNDPPGSVTPPGHWNEFAQDVSARDKHSLDDDVKMFFALNAAELDTSIAVWEAKRFYDAIRPISAVRYWYAGQKVVGWDGAGNGIITIDGSQWTPWIPTPAHPEFPSGHSAFSSAAASILRKFTGSDTYVKSLVFLAGSSTIDPGNSPTQATTLSWLTFSEVGDDAGYSRRAGGIHYDEADYRSRTIGREVAETVWTKYSNLIAGISH